MTLKDMSLSKKLAFAICIFLVSVVLLTYFLITEKDDLINFTRTEIAGVRYLRAATGAVGVLAADWTKDEVIKAADDLQKAEQVNGGGLAVTQKSSELAAELRAVTGGKAEMDAAAKAAALISAISDNSNITLDPDLDAYFVGDILVNQAQGVLQQTNNLINATHDLEQDKSDDHKIAFAEARDGAIASAGNNRLSLIRL
jgi:hypothetical protein